VPTGNHSYATDLDECIWWEQFRHANIRPNGIRCLQKFRCDGEQYVILAPQIDPVRVDFDYI
jgi:hypothetical protein